MNTNFRDVVGRRTPTAQCPPNMRHYEISAINIIESL